jgi:mycofactocin precursor
MAKAQPAPETLPAPVEAADSTMEPPPAPSVDELVEEDLLVEDVSIDGMCGVY